MPRKPRTRENVSETMSTDTVETETATGHGGARKPIDTGSVVIRPAADQSATGRHTRMNTDPVPLAVRDAENGLWYEIGLESADKAEGVKSLLRRAGAHFDKGVHIDPRDDLTDSEGFPIVRFKTSAERKGRKPTAQADSGDTVAADGQIVGEPTEATDAGEPYDGSQYEHQHEYEPAFSG